MLEAANALFGVPTAEWHALAALSCPPEALAQVMEGVVLLLGREGAAAPWTVKRRYLMNASANRKEQVRRAAVAAWRMAF